MLNLDTEIQTDRQDSEGFEVRITEISRATVREYQSKSSEYGSLDISLHNAKLETLRIRNKTIKLGSGERVNIKRISFERADGVDHEIEIFGERY